MLKGTLEGVVLAILSRRPAYGYEITARLREMGFLDIAEGTVYALLIRIEQRGLVDVEKHPSLKGPPRKVYSLNAQGQDYLEEFWRTWGFLTERLEQLRGRRQIAVSDAEKAGFISKMIGDKRRWRAYKARVRGCPRTTAPRSTRSSATSCTSGRSTAIAQPRCSRTSPTCSSRPQRPNAHPRDRRRGPGGVRRGVRSELPEGRIR